MEKSPENNPTTEKPHRIIRLNRENGKALGKHFLEEQKKRKKEEEERNANEARILRGLGQPFSVLPDLEKEENAYDEENKKIVEGLGAHYADRKLKIKQNKESQTKKVKERNTKNNKGEENAYHAKGLEYAFVALAGKEWLCPTDGSEIIAYSSSEYDDMCGNRIDTVIDLRLSSDEHILFGIDLYSEDSKEKANQSTAEENNRGWHRVKKILQSNNDESFAGPIGFSKINSYPKSIESKLTAGNAIVEEKEEGDNSVQIPRFVVGIDRDEIDILLRQFKDGQYDLTSYREQKIKKPFSVFEHYSILQELIDQTELFAKIQNEKDSVQNADSIELLEKLGDTFKQMRSNLYDAMFEDSFKLNKDQQKEELEKLFSENYSDCDKYTAMSKMIAKYRKDRVFMNLSEITSTLKRYSPDQIDAIKAECRNKEHTDSYRTMARAAIKISSLTDA